MNTACLLHKDRPREKAMDYILQSLMALSVKKTWKIVWGEAKSERSELQNNALFGVAYKYLEEQTGNNKIQLHDYFCREFFGEKDQETFGKRSRQPRRTTTTDENGNRSVLSKFEFMQFYSFIQQHMAEKLGLSVPDPDPFWRDHQEAA